METGNIVLRILKSYRCLFKVDKIGSEGEVNPRRKNGMSALFGQLEGFSQTSSFRILTQAKPQTYSCISKTSWEKNPATSSTQ